MSFSVLVVDDDDEIRHMLCMLLQLTGYDTDQAVDGLDAQSKIRQNQPDIIILDVMMPNMDGITLCKLLRAEEPTACLPIIMLSGKTDGDAIAEGLQVGADRYLTKPTGLDILTETMNDLLQNALTEQRSSQLYR